MITVELAVRLRDAGLEWVPSSGDRFVIPDRELDDEVFVISEMTIESEQLATGGIVRFNGTTEWALDSIDQSAVVWLPRESQMRSLLGERFVRLEAVPGGFAVELSPGTANEAQPGQLSAHEVRHVDVDAERAYARALLAVL